MFSIVFNTTVSILVLNLCFDPQPPPTRGKRVLKSVRTGSLETHAAPLPAPPKPGNAGRRNDLFMCDPELPTQESSSLHVTPTRPYHLRGNRKPGSLPEFAHGAPDVFAVTPSHCNLHQACNDHASGNDLFMCGPKPAPRNFRHFLPAPTATQMGGRNRGRPPSQQPAASAARRGDKPGGGDPRMETTGTAEPPAAGPRPQLNRTARTHRKKTSGATDFRNQLAI